MAVLSFPLAADPAERRPIRAFDLFRLYALSRRIALHVEVGRTPPPHLLRELGVQVAED